MKTDLSVPTVHLNGSDRKTLLDGLISQVQAIEAAMNVMRENAPHGRDYYVQGDAAFAKARGEYLERLAALERVQKDLRVIYRAVHAQGRKQT